MYIPVIMVHGPLYFIDRFTIPSSALAEVATPVNVPRSRVNFMLLPVFEPYLGLEAIYLFQFVLGHRDGSWSES